MTSFVVIAALLVAAALAFLLTPLVWIKRGGGSAVSRRDSNVAVYRDQLADLERDLRDGALADEQLRSAKKELERRLLEDVAATEGRTVRRPSKLAAAALGIAVPLFAALLYFWLGNFDALTARTDEGHAVSPAQVEAMVSKLAVRLEREPENVEGWTLLGRSLAVLGKYPEAARAYAAAVKLSADDAQLLVDYADVLGMAQGRKLDGEPEALVRRALAIDPRNVKALALAGTIAFERREFDGAIEYWQRTLPLVPPESELGQSVRSSIADAEAQGGKRSAALARGAPTVKALKGVVTLAPALAARVGPGDTVFVFARSGDPKEPRTPFALLRKSARDLPIKFTLDDSTAMNPAVPLSGAGEVVVVARVSRSGSASPQPGDLEGISRVVKPGANGIKVVIDGEAK